jgi:murein DD-endopeptidase MepM/ murein hydrolase activator NlpD
MTTLHALRRHYDLSLGELAQLTGISTRRLAEYEYEDRPLPPEDERALRSLFSAEHSVASGWAVAAPVGERGTRQTEQTLLLAALAATAALSGTLGWGDAGRALVEGVTHTLPARVGQIEPPAPTPSQTLGPAAIVLPVPPLPTATIAIEPVEPTPTARPTEPPVPPFPHRCPVVSERGTVAVIAGYTAGTHEPASANGAVDLAIDADADGLAEPWASRNAAVVATHGGTVVVRLDTWPVGNEIVIEGRDGWRTAYAHLDSVAVRTGDRIKPGQTIGTIGATGQAGGPHLDYKVWHDGENTDPTPMLKCD